MKSLFFLLATVCLLAAPAMAQKGEKPSDDGSYSYETRDPFGNPVTVVVDPPIRNAVNNPWDDPSSEIFRGFEVEESEKFGKEEMIRAATVSVYAVASQSYRSQYANWEDKLYNVIETADNAYYRDFGINWVIQGYYSWTSNGSSANAILADLASDGSGLPDGLCMGFTRYLPGAGGIAYVYNFNPGTGYSVCLDQGDTSTVYALRHEIGHNYGCGHDPTGSSPVCMMNYQYAYSVDYFDSAHAATVNSHMSWFN